jgi:hypothetical protein
MTNATRARDLLGASADCIEFELDEAEQRGFERGRAEERWDVVARCETNAEAHEHNMERDRECSHERAYQRGAAAALLALAESLRAAHLPAKETT